MIEIKADAGAPVSASRFGWFLFLSKPVLDVSSSSPELSNRTAVASDTALSKDVIDLLASSPHPWYESDQFLAGLGLFIGVCAIYLILSYLRGDDDGDMPGGSTSGIGPDRGLLSLLSSEEAVSDSDDFLWWGIFSSNERFAVLTLLLY